MPPRRRIVSQELRTFNTSSPLCKSTVEGHGIVLRTFSTNTWLPYITKKAEDNMEKVNRLYFFAALFLGLVGGVAKAGPIKGK